MPPPRLPLCRWGPLVLVAGRLGASEAGEDVVATPTQGGGLLDRGCSSAARGEATLATVHADAPHLGRCWSRRRERAIPPARSHRRWPADLVELNCRLALLRSQDRGFTFRLLAAY